MKDLLMLNLGDYFVTTKGGFCPQRINEYSKQFDRIYVFCLGNEGKKKFNKNTFVYSGSLLKWIYFFLKIDKKNIRFVKIQDYTLGGVLGVIFSKILKVPLVMRCGGTWEHKGFSFKNIVLKITKPIVFSNVSKIIFNSNYIKDKVLLKKKIDHKVIYNGVDLKKFYPAKKKFEKKILYVGRVRKDKGLLYLKEAMRKLPDYNLTVVGEGDLKKEIDKEDNIRCIGRKKHERIADIMRKHDIFVLPSLPESSESFPSSLLEALACGLEVIATDVAGIPEIIPKKYIIKPYSSDAIVKAIKNKRFYKNHRVFDIRKQLKKLNEGLFWEKNY